MTGLGLVSSIGCSSDVVVSALRNGTSGITHSTALEAAGMRCHVYGAVRDWDPGVIPKRARQTMSPSGMYAAAAALQALADARLAPDAVDPFRGSVIVGTEFGGINELSRMHELLMRGKKSRAGGVGTVKLMNSSAAGNLAALIGMNGRAYSVSSSFGSGIDSIGHAYELIRHDAIDVAVCGGTEEDCWRQLLPYLERLKVVSTVYNERPEQACRPYDVDRAGMVMSAGSGILVLESLAHAAGRGARVYAEIVGYGSANDGSDMFRPSGQGLSAALRQALDTAAKHDCDHIDYVNTHGTGSPVGDAVEAKTLGEVVGDVPWVGSTKGLTGHGLGAAGALEAVYTLLMMANGFVAPTRNLVTVDPRCRGLRHAQTVVETDIEAAICFNVGLGGANSCIIFQSLAP